jgi:hypothetical protein
MADTGHYRLLRKPIIACAPDSPLIDRGIPASQNRDLAGNPVPQGNAPDIGVYESSFSASPVPQPAPTYTPVQSSPAAGENLLSAGVSGFQIFAQEPADGQLHVLHSGEESLEITTLTLHPTSSFYPYLTYPGIPIQQGEQYTLEFRIRAEQPRTLAFYFQSTTTWRRLNAPVYFTAGTEWQDYSFVIDPAESDRSARMLIVNFGTRTGKTYLAGVRFHQQTEIPEPVRTPTPSVPLPIPAPSPTVTPLPYPDGGGGENHEGENLLHAGLDGFEIFQNFGGSKTLISLPDGQQAVQLTIRYPFFPI